MNGHSHYKNNAKSLLSDRIIYVTHLNWQGPQKNCDSLYYNTKERNKEAYDGTY